MRKIVLFLLILLIPTQLGWHWWPEWAKVWGVRIDYLSPTLYLVDLVWLGLMVVNYKSQIPNYKKIFKNKYFWLGVVLVVANLWVAGNVGVAIYKWLRIGQALITVALVKSQKSKVKRMLKYIIPVWVVMEVGLGLSQVINGGSLQGIFYWLGERNFNGSWPGVAVWSLMGTELVRAYGTFSHPNSLAGFLLVSMLIWWKIRKGKEKTLGYWLFLWLGLAGLVITGSRVVWVLLVILLMTNVKCQMTNAKKTIGLSMVIIGLVLIWWANREVLGGWDNESLNKRWDLNMAALKMWRDWPLFGVGLNNFLVKLPEYGGRWWQPVHNIPLLWLSELGIMGVAMLQITNHKLQITNKIIKNGWWKIGLVVIVTSLVDHYWWTLPQNWWLLTVLLGLLV